MSGHRHKLLIFYCAVCTSQLIVIAMGLAVAYQILRSYSANIDYEISLNTARRTVTELSVLSREALPENLVLDGTAVGPNQFSQIDYAARLFLPKAQALLVSSVDIPGAPLERARDHLQTAILEMAALREQSARA